MRYFKKNFILLGKSCARIDRDKRIKRIKEHEIQKKRLLWKRKKKKAHSSCSRNYYCFCFEYSVRSDESVRNRGGSAGQNSLAKRKLKSGNQILTFSCSQSMNIPDQGRKWKKSEGL